MQRHTDREIANTIKRRYGPAHGEENFSAALTASGKALAFKQHHLILQAMLGVRHRIHSTCWNAVVNVEEE